MINCYNVHKLNVRKFMLCFILLPFLKPFYITLIQNLDYVFKFWKVCSIIAIAAMWLKRIPSVRISIDKLLLLCFIMFYAVAEIRNGVSISNSINEMTSIVFLVMFLDIYKNDTKFIHEILKCVSVVTKIYIVMNLFTIIYRNPILGADFTKTEYTPFFLGPDNYSAFILIPLCGIMFAYDKLHFKSIRKNTWFFALLGCLSYWITLSATAMVSYTILLIIIWLSEHRINRKDIKKIFSIKKIAILCLVTVPIVIGIAKFNLIQNMIVYLFGTEKTAFNSRDIIWSKAVGLILKRPLGGYGVLTEQQINAYWLYGVEHPHNFFLGVLFATGVFGAMCYFGWMFFSVRNKAKEGFESIKFILYLTLAAVLFCGIFDYYLMNIYIYLLVLLMNQISEDRIYFTCNVN